ncbi:AmmeMemoRadiSam system protein B [Thiothrix eikelboomii]|uniref:AmmeMemoRadiSam system protein B n=1 Tax=Thiothrix eikelboomii TaxID=92487 RepID=UPI003BB0A6EB
MKILRPALYSGIFYSADPDNLRLQLKYYLDHPSESNHETIKALVVPHAGYDYSGRTAGSTYAQVRGKTKPKRIVLVGPNHQNAHNGGLISDYTALQTPLGEISVDQTFIHNHWQPLDYVQVDNATHATEYSLEVQLPFIHTCFPELPVAPLLLGPCSTEQAQFLLKPAWEDPETLIVISSDLYHYLPRSQALLTGMQTIRLIEAKHSDRLTPDQACGYLGLKGLIQLAQQPDYVWRTIAAHHSAQSNHLNPSNLVGYAGLLLVKPLSFLSTDPAYPNEN